MCPVLCEKRVIDETCTMSVDESELYPECVVTRAMAKKAEREPQNVAIGVIYLAIHRACEIQQNCFY